MRRIQLNSVQLNAVTINSAGERWRGSHAGAPPVVPDVPDIPEDPDIPEEPDVPSDPDVDENGYIIFADPEVKRVLLANGVGDGVGITKEAAAEVTSVGTWFKGNAEITSFEEFSKFANAQAIPANAFDGCSTLNSIDLSKVTSLGASALYNCTSLEIEDLQLPNLETLGINAFYGVKIKKISDLGKITQLPWGSVYTQNFGDKSYLEEVVFPEGLIEVPSSSFSGYSKLSKVEWPTTLAKIGEYCFSECTSLPSTLELPYVTYIAYAAFNSVGVRRVILPNIETLEFGGNYAGVFVKNDVEFIHLGAKCSLIGSYTFSYATDQTPLTMICEAVTPPSLGDSIFHASGGKTFDFVYVPDASVEAYKTATNWSAYANRIFPVSQLATDNPELYAEIQEYL